MQSPNRVQAGQMSGRRTALIGIALLLGSVSCASAPAGSPSAAPAGYQADSREISRSRGVEDGLVLLWPRTITGTGTGGNHAMAADVQEQLRRILAETFPGRPIDVRPEPERVCGQAGCLATSVGALVLNDGDGYAVLVTVGPPGRTSTRILPWAGRVRIQSNPIPFRSAPESYVTVEDFAPRGEVAGLLAAGAPGVSGALRDFVR